ncbi:MAG: FAD:protein FMN transferase [candidate division WOR-3 bacterium]
MTRLKASLAIAFIAGLSCDQPQGFVTVDYIVMGTSARVIIPLEDRALADSAYAQMLAVDSLMSIWKRGSELSELNAKGAMRLSRPTLRCVEVGLAAARTTRGAFDPTVWPLVHAWGFDSDSPHPPDPESLESARGLVDWQKVNILGDSVILGPGQRLDLGGVAKGYALDMAAAKLLELGCSSFLVEIGGDMICYGQKGSQPWVIGIRDPRNPGDIVGTIRISSSKGTAICTSGDYERFVEIGGTRYAHIMDPRKGEPSKGVVSVTLISYGDAAMTDAMATGLFVMGPDEGIRLAESSGMRAMFIYHDGDTLGIAKTADFPEIDR